MADETSTEKVVIAVKDDEAKEEFKKRVIADLLARGWPIKDK